MEGIIPLGSFRTPGDKDAKIQKSPIIGLISYRLVFRGIKRPRRKRGGEVGAVCGGALFRREPLRSGQEEAYQAEGVLGS